MGYQPTKHEPVRPWPNPPPKKDDPAGLSWCTCRNCGAPNQNTKCRYCGERVPG